MNHFQVTPKLPETVPHTENHLFALMEPGDLDRLRADFEHVLMPVHYELSPASALIEFAYFMNSGVGSLITTLNDGSSVEVGIIGRDGFWGGALLAGIDSTPEKGFVQIEGSGYRIKGAAYARGPQQPTA